jgi:hypothetical protein
VFSFQLQAHFSAFSHQSRCLAQRALSLGDGDWLSERRPDSAASGQSGFTPAWFLADGYRIRQRHQPRTLYTNQIYLNGSGVTAGDVDGDGWCDLFFAGLNGASRLYHNEGNWKFTDITQSAG